MNPSEAFYLQAQSDWEMYQRLTDASLAAPPAPPCHSLHYLQMTIEKLAKAIISAYEGEFPETHGVVGRLFKALERHDAADLLGYEGRFSQYKSRLHGLRPLAAQIESLHPQLPPVSPNVEYPWITGGEGSVAEWTAPADPHHTFPVFDRLRHAEGRDLLNFLTLLLDRRFPPRG